MAFISLVARIRRAGRQAGRLGWWLVGLAVLPAMAQEPGHVHGPGYQPVEQSTELALPCPVMPHKPANGKYRYAYEGRTYYFCCSDCLEDFRENPRQYIKAEQAAVAMRSGSGHAHWAGLMDLMGANMVALSGVVLAVVVALLGWLFRRRRPSAGAWLLRFAWLPLVAALFAQARQDQVERAGAEERLQLMLAKDYFNYAVQHDFGSPPVPRRPAIPPRLRGMYYRGNDERTEQLWNNGHYRTSSFDLRLEKADGTPVNHGDRLEPGDLQVQLDIIRAPFTAEEFWSPAVMNTIFMTRDADPVGGHADATRLVTIEPRQRFTVGYPAVSITGRGTERLRGIIYVCEDMTMHGIKGARYHLAIQYDLLVEEGVVQPASDLWMGALYRTRRVPPWRLPLDEWFSHLPIPELPHAHTTTDPTALGTADYQRIIEEGAGKPDPRP